MANAIDVESRVIERPKVDDTPVPPPTDTATLYQRQIAQAEYELALLREIPEMRKQVATIEARLMLHKRCAQIAEAGFPEFIPPSSWVQGFLSAPIGVDRRKIVATTGKAKGDFHLYHRAMPAAAIAKYKAAKDSGLFNFFTVHSPNREDFQVQDHVVTLGERADRAKLSIGDVLERMSRIDPILIGWVNAEVRLFHGNYERIQVMNEKIGNHHTFLIAQWDLARDLAYDLPMLEAPKE
jgi:hypothetical protein